MSDPPKALLAALQELQDKAEGLRQARQAAKDPGQIELELQRKLDQKRKQATACKDRLDKAKSDLAYYEALAQKAAKAIAVEESLRARFRNEIKELFTLLGEQSESDSDDERDDDKESHRGPNAAALAKDHMVGDPMDLDDPHKAGLALMLAGRMHGRAETGWSAAPAAATTSQDGLKAADGEGKPRSRSPKSTRVAEAAAAFEAKLAA
jgi:hypothetical protein